MPCSNNPPLATCSGPTGAVHLRCGFCKEAVANKASIRARRGSVSRIAATGATGVEIQTEWNTRADKVIADLFHSALADATLSSGIDNPGSWAFCISGSGARQEACPYSDLDCFLLVEVEDASIMALFRSASSKLRTMLTAMGEDEDVDHLGLRFCFAGLHPLGLGTRSAPELIGTPARLAALIENGDVDGHIRQGLSESRCLCGIKSLHDTYLSETEAVRGKSLSAPWTRPMLPGRKKLGLSLIAKGAAFRIPSATAEIDIKVDVYRLPQFVLAGLAAYYDVAEQNSFRIVTALNTRNKLNARSVASFTKVLNAVARMRTVAHLEQEREGDMLVSPTAPANDNVQHLDEADWKILMECRFELGYLQSCAVRFCTDKKSALKSNRVNIFAA